MSASTPFEPVACLTAPLTPLPPTLSGRCLSRRTSLRRLEVRGSSRGWDHGWGAHHLAMGGAVKGARTYGQWPALAVNGPDDTETGRWIPTTAIDQYFATLATWFGVDNSNLANVFPNLGRFSTPNLGFV